jgi:DNA invertase Pin-like site-specific DNA recombinase
MVGSARVQPIFTLPQHACNRTRAKGTTFGRPKSAAKKTAEIKRLYRKEKLSKSEIARRLGIGRNPVRRLLEGG